MSAPLQTITNKRIAIVITLDSLIIWQVKQQRKQKYKRLYTFV